MRLRPMRYLCAGFKFILTSTVKRSLLARRCSSEIDPTETLVERDSWPLPLVIRSRHEVPTCISCEQGRPDSPALPAPAEPNIDQIWEEYVALHNRQDPILSAPEATGRERLAKLSSPSRNRR